MTREKIFNTIGFSLLGLCFLLALFSIAKRSREESDPKLITIRFAHWQLEGGLRKTYEELSRRYEEICAARGERVRVVQIAIPERVYPNWIVTQLVGGMAPQIIEMGVGLDVDRIARYLEPISDEVEQPNPYNRGTHLEGLAWRNTFIDGMQSAYDANLLDYYGVPTSIFTVRLFYNKQLFHKIFGADAAPPANYRDFLAACEKILAYGRAHGETITPVAGSKYNAIYVNERIFGSQTQKLALAINSRQTLKLDDNERLLAYLRGEWSIRSPEVTAGLRLLQSYFRYFQPGFQQVDRDTATFYFVQGRSVFTVTGSWDNTSFRIQAPFDIGVCQIPIPSKDDPEFGVNILGSPSEAGKDTALPFGLVRGSSHSKVALDFLKYLTSYEGNSLFSKQSGWLPSVVGVPVAEELKPFLLEENGYVNGFIISAMADTTRAFDNSYYLLQTFPDTPEPFQKNMEQVGFENACFTDMERVAKGTRRNTTRLDTVVHANYSLSQNGANAERERKFRELEERQVQYESDIYSIEFELSQYRQRKGKN